jgi:hypothetical protein
MKTLILLSIVSASLLWSCGNSKKLDIANIQRLYIDHNPDQNINYGKQISAKVVALMISGEEIVVTNHKKLQINSPKLDFTSSDQVKILGHPTTFNNEVIIAELVMSDKEETFSATDSVALNYRGPLHIGEYFRSGSDGEDQKNRGTRLVGRNGKDGDDGPLGENGTNGGNYTVHIWKVEAESRVKVTNNVSGEVWRYKSVNNDECVFDFPGGAGGDGGDAGDGGDGKDGKVTEDGSDRTGHGGDGGNGGNGGNGGHGGIVSVIIHTNASASAGKVAVNNPGGRNGTYGEGGKAGKGGTADTGQVDGLPGLIGVRGVAGSHGNQGPTTVVKVEEFDISTM